MFHFKTYSRSYSESWDAIIIPSSSLNLFILREVGSKKEHECYEKLYGSIKDVQHYQGGSYDRSDRVPV